jgi:hypothetical protein
MFAVALTALALTGTAASVPVSGGTADQRAIVSKVLAQAGPGVVTSARIDARHYLVLGPPAVRAPLVRFTRANWQAELLAQAAADTLAGRQEPVAGYTVAGGQTVPYAGPSQPPVLDLAMLQQLRGAVLSRARTAGLGVRAARVVRIGSGALDLVVRLRERQLLDDRGQAALSTLFGSGQAGAGEQHFLDVEAPDGTAIAYGGTFANAGSWSYGGDTAASAVPRRIPETLWKAHTDVTVQVTGRAGARTFRITCGGGRPRPGSRCARLLADRWSLLVPVVPGIICGGNAGAGWDVSVRGTFAGSPVSREYGSCYDGTGARWARFLGA